MTSSLFIAVDPSFSRVLFVSGFTIHFEKMFGCLKSVLFIMPGASTRNIMILLLFGNVCRGDNPMSRYDQHWSPIWGILSHRSWGIWINGRSDRWNPCPMVDSNSPYLILFDIVICINNQPLIIWVNPCFLVVSCWSMTTADVYRSLLLRSDSGSGYWEDRQQQGTQREMFARSCGGCSEPHLNKTYRMVPPK